MEWTTRSDVIAMLQDVLLDTAGVDEFLDGVAQAAARHVGPATSATITLRRDGRATLVAASDPRAAECDETEYAADDGPCLARSTWVTSSTSRISSTETRWPAWRAVTQQNGYASAAALPRSVRPGAHIALNLYATEPNSWNEAAIAVADMYADEIARAVTLSLRAADQAELNADLRAALVSRAVIDQAIGVVMAENRCTRRGDPDPAQRVAAPQGQASGRRSRDHRGCDGERARRRGHLSRTSLTPSAGGARLTGAPEVAGTDTSAPRPWSDPCRPASR